MLTEASLYVHVPFCVGSCDYCDFYSIPLKPEDPRKEFFVETVLSEAERLFNAYRPERIPTLFIGGGTPSVLGPVWIRRLLFGLSRLIARASIPPDEITIEANPESADEAFLAAIREGGVTRLSLGVQSFYAPSRQAVHRTGDEALLPERLALAAKYFPGAFSADLISGLPLQDEKVLLDDIAALAGYSPAHISLYALTVEKGSPMEIDRDKADSLWLYGRDALESRGFRQYEVSNFCLKGRESQHNIRYWRLRNWLALGPAASGTIIDDENGTGFRYTIPPDVDRWLAAGGCEFSKKSGLNPTSEELNVMTMIKETFLMGFRYAEGPDEGLFQKRFRREISDCLPETLKAWQDRRLLQKNKCALTKEALLFLDPLLLEVFRELDSLFSVY